jgi:hypothetical protein
MTGRRVTNTRQVSGFHLRMHIKQFPELVLQLTLGNAILFSDELNAKLLKWLRPPLERSRRIAP